MKIKANNISVVTYFMMFSTSMAAFIWSTPGRNADWNAATNWQPEAIPQNVDVVIDGETNFNSTVSLNTNVTVNNLTVSPGDTLIIQTIPYVLTIDGRNSPVVVDNQGTITLNGNVSGNKGLYIEGSVTWTNNGLAVTGNQNYSQFKVQPGASLTICEGTSFNFYNQSWCNGIVTNYGEFKIGGLFLGGGGTQVNAGAMEFRNRLSMDVINYIGNTNGTIRLKGINQEGTCNIEGGIIQFSGGNFDMYRSGIGHSVNITGTNETYVESNRFIRMTRRSVFNLSAEGYYDIDGTIEMDVIRAGTHHNVTPYDSQIIANNGFVHLNGDGVITMNAGILTNSALVAHFKHSILTGATADDALVNNLTGGIYGAGKIGNNESSFVNRSLIDATDDTYALDFNPGEGGVISNTPSGIIQATGAAGLIFQDGTFINNGTIAILPDSQAVFSNSLSFNNDQGTLAFTIGSSSNQTPVIKTYGDLTLSGTLSVNIATDYDGGDAQLYDLIICTDGTITDNGITLTNLNKDVQFYIVDNGSSDGTLTVKQRSGGSIFIIR